MLIGANEYPCTYDEDDLREFTKTHWPFFYNSENSPHREFVGILWPKIEHYRRIWHEHRESDYGAAAKIMSADLSAAKVKPPEWPPRPELQERRRKFMSDNEIPF
jgi:hypothetical protein